MQYIRNTIPELMPASAPESPSHPAAAARIEAADPAPSEEALSEPAVTPEPVVTPPASTGVASSFADDFEAFEDEPVQPSPAASPARQPQAASPRSRAATMDTSPRSQHVRQGKSEAARSSPPPSPMSMNVHVSPGRYCYKVKYLGSRAAGAVCSGDAACQALSKMRTSGKLLLDKDPIALVITAKTVEYIEVETDVSCLLCFARLHSRALR